MTEQALATIPERTAVQAVAGMALTFDDMRARVKALSEFYDGVMQAGTDYDTLPGTPKPTLLQPGAQLLDGIFGLAPTFEQLPSSVRNFETGFFFIEVRCRLLSKQTGTVAAEGIGSCNSKEDKYRWRTAKRVCPVCHAEAIIKGKAEYGGGWVCFKKQGGCGRNWPDGAVDIEWQTAGRIENDDTYTLLNTISKMAQKRAHVAATLNATGASRIFTQDVEDLPPVYGGVIDVHPATAAPVAPPAASRAGAAPQPSVSARRAGGMSYTQRNGGRCTDCGANPCICGTVPRDTTTWQPVAAGPATRPPDEDETPARLARALPVVDGAAAPVERAPAERARAGGDYREPTDDEWTVWFDAVKERTGYSAGDVSILLGRAPEAHLRTLNASGTPKTGKGLLADLIAYKREARPIPGVATAEPAPAPTTEPESEAVAHLRSDLPKPDLSGVLGCAVCGNELAETVFRDGTRWTPADLARITERKHGKPLCMTHHREFNAARAGKSGELAEATAR